MARTTRTKLVREGAFAAEVDLEMIVTEDEWSPCLSLANAYRLDDVREALRRGDLAAAAQNARVYELVPVAA